MKLHATIDHTSTEESPSIQALAVQLGERSGWPQLIEDFLPTVLDNVDELERTLVPVEGKLLLGDKEFTLIPGRYLVYVHEATAFTVVRALEDIQYLVDNPHVLSTSSIGDSAAELESIRKQRNATKEAATLANRPQPTKPIGATGYRSNLDSMYDASTMSSLGAYAVSDG